MALRDVLVRLGAKSVQEPWLDAAIAFARRHEAHMTALYLIASPSVPTHTAPMLPPDLVHLIDREVREAAQRARKEFLQRTRRAGLDAEWREALFELTNPLILLARDADLCVVGHPSDEPLGTDPLTFLGTLVLSAGRPVLAIPSGQRAKTVASRVLLAWDGSREAARALHDSLPILEKAEGVLVFSVNLSEDRIAGEDVCAHLARHGVQAEARSLTGHHGSVGEALLGAASKQGADLLVMGAYGHSRFRELVLGGATREVLKGMSVPVLLAH